jgi:hypothetical protein
VSEEGASREDQQSWSERAEIAIATVSAYQAELPEEEPAAAPAEPSRLGSAAVLAMCVVIELLWLTALAYLLHVTGVL